MYDEYVKRIDVWFEKNANDLETYHHTEEKDGEDVYAVSDYNLSVFMDFLREEIPDMVGIPCFMGCGGIWFTSDDLDRTQFY